MHANLETASLLPITVYRDVVPLQRLHDEVAHHPAIVGVHPRAKGVEDPEWTHADKPPPLQPNHPPTN